jgi:phosphohistidine phosphatase
MKRLFLLRHGKAQPADGSTEDFERTLLLSGMQDASAMARYLRKGDYKLDLVLCSTSARTTQTAELVLQALESEIEYRDNLYLADVSKLLAAVRGAPAVVTNLMLVGEPVRRKERARHEALEEKFPTGALAILDFDIGRWRDVEKSAGKLVDFVRPKDV